VKMGGKGMRVAWTEEERRGGELEQGRPGFG